MRIICLGLLCFVLTSVRSQNLRITDTIISNPVCADTATGSIGLVVEGGVQPYNFFWQDQFSSNEGFREGLGPGIYLVRITDASGNDTLNAVIELKLVTHSFPPGSIRPTICSQPENCNGKAKVEVPEEGIYDIKWSSGSNGIFGENLCMGWNSLTMTESISSCEFIDSVFVPCVNPDTVHLFTECIERNTCGQVQRVSVAVAGFEDLVSASFSLVWDTANVEFIGLENRHVEFDDTLAVTEHPSGRGLGVIWFTDQLETGTTLADSTVLFDLVLGMKNPGEFSVAPSAELVAIEFTDINSIIQFVKTRNCFIKYSDQPVIPGLVIREPDCGIGRGGFAQLDVHGGAPPYSYSWSTGDSLSSVENLAEGEYSVTVSDTEGCVKVLQFMVADPDPVQGTIEKVTAIVCHGDSAASLAVQLPQGSGITKILWSTGASDDTLRNIPAGNYTAWFEINGICYGTDTIEIDQPVPMEVADTIIVPDSGNREGFIGMFLTGGVVPYRYQWSTGDTTRAVTKLMSGTYEVTVTDGIGCVSTFTFEVPSVTAADDLYLGDDSVIVFPNPATAAGVKLKIEAQKAEWILIRIFDPSLKSAGERYYQTIPGINEIDIRLGNADGLYFIQLLNPENRQRLLQVIKH